MPQLNFLRVGLVPTQSGTLGNNRMKRVSKRPMGRFIIFFSSISLGLLATNAWVAEGEEEHSAEDHAEHMQDPEHEHDAGPDQHAQHSTERDAEGRRLHDMKHEITDEIADELRAKVPSYENYSNADIGMSMAMMGPNYEWYISDTELVGDRGLLILAHGFRDRGDRDFKQQVQPMADVFPTAFAFGMAMMMSDHIQLALDDLEAAGAKQIIVIPAVSTPHNSLMRQWEYIFDLRDEAEYASVPRVQTEAEILIVAPPGDDPLVAEILLDFAYEISTDPENEIVIIVAHGPSFADDNVKELEMLANLAEFIMEDGDFANVVGMTLQDDAPRDVRAANVQRIRAVVEDARSEGKEVLVVTNLMGTRTIQAQLRRDLGGLDFSFNANGITQHDNFIKWLGVTVRAEMDRS